MLFLAERPKLFRTDLGLPIELLLGLFALLISDAAAGLASGLARGLALAAAAVLRAVAQITGIERLNHGKFPPYID